MFKRQVRWVCKGPDVFEDSDLTQSPVAVAICRTDVRSHSQYGTPCQESLSPSKLGHHVQAAKDLSNILTSVTAALKSPTEADAAPNGDGGDGDAGGQSRAHRDLDDALKRSSGLDGFIAECKLNLPCTLHAAFTSIAGSIAEKLMESPPCTLDEVSAVVASQVSLVFKPEWYGVVEAMAAYIQEQNVFPIQPTFANYAQFERFIRLRGRYMIALMTSIQLEDDVLPQNITDTIFAIKVNIGILSKAHSDLLCLLDAHIMTAEDLSLSWSRVFNVLATFTKSKDDDGSAKELAVSTMSAMAGEGAPTDDIKQVVAQAVTMVPMATPTAKAPSESNKGSDCHSDADKLAIFSAARPLKKKPRPEQSTKAIAATAAATDAGSHPEDQIHQEPAAVTKGDGDGNKKLLAASNVAINDIASYTAEGELEESSDALKVCEVVDAAFVKELGARIQVVIWENYRRVQRTRPAAPST